MRRAVAIIICVCSFGSYAQWENAYAFIGGGTSYYQGDLNATAFPTPKILNLSFKGGLGYNFNKRYGIVLHYTESSLSADDAFVNNAIKNARGLSFESPLKEIGLNLKIRNITGKQETYIGYLFTGINYFQFNPTLTRSGFATINYVVESSYPTSGFNIPFGVGFGIWLTDNFGLVWEASLHVTYTDYIDGVSSNGNPNYKDAFVDSHVKLLYSFSQWVGRGKKTQKKSKGWSPKKVKPIQCPGL
ncbi:MAG: hypothetical protein CMD35_01585 [Flavobacteriales bacterium]|nr:hypothetical protein [Flavobacteriales bacterium]|tara:strand:+ start:848 stop:1582 length:735 start_codon:yes stop_codon:yes gene_type:complete